MARLNKSAAIGKTKSKSTPRAAMNKKGASAGKTASTKKPASAKKR